MKAFYKTFGPPAVGGQARLSVLRTRLGVFGFVLALLFTVQTAFGQGATISGTVKEADGTPLPGVTVQVKGTTRGTNTDIDGRYQLTNVQPGATLVFSFIGKTPQEAVVGNQSVIDVTLADDSKSLQEVVVVGYGTQRRKDLTGSIASISAEEFQKGNIVNPEQLVAGKLAGVQITPPSGQPGGGSTIRIRGGSSLNASNDPLVVIDGVPLDNREITGASNALSLINPNDIETFTVLKDASAAAIYGSRAANGVILITTKKGRTGDQTRISFSTLGSVSVNGKQLSTLNATQFRELINRIGNEDQKALLNVGTTPETSTNWQDQIFRPAFSTDNNLSITGSTRSMPYRASVGYISQNGTLKTSNFQRVSGSLGLSPRFFNNTLRVDINLKGSIINNRFADVGAIGAAVAFDPTKPVYSGNENFGGFYEWLTPTGIPNPQATRNPLGLLYNRDDRTEIARSIGNVQFDYQLPFVQGLRANLNLGYDISKSEGLNFTPAYAGAQFVQGGNGGQSQKSTGSRNNKTLEFYLNYVKQLNPSNRIDATAGYSYQDFIRDVPSYPNLRANGRDTIAAAGIPFRTQYTLLAFFGRINYSLKDRYVLTATVRRDATSRFGPDSRWGTFPSLGFSWSIKDEPFLKSANALSALKLRLGYGVTGQQDLTGLASDYAYLPRYTISDPTAQYQFGNTFIRTLRAEGYDANLKWEETEAINAAVDVAFFDGRLGGSLDVYQKNTRDLLAVIPVPAGTNLTNQVLTNVGSLRNRGIELTVNTNPIRRDGMNLDVNFNVTYNENKITNLTRVPVPNDPGVQVGGISGGTGNFIQIQTVGYPINTFYVLRQVYNQSGLPVEGVYEDRNGDGQITVDDRVRYQASNPNWLMGFTTQFTYGRFNAGLVLRGTVGNYVYNNTRSNGSAYNNFVNALGFLSNGLDNVLTTNFTRSQYFSDYYVENASFVRLDNLNLGYNFGSIWGKGDRKANLRGTLTAQNLFVITKYSGLDPEIDNGRDNNFYPRPRIVSAGLNLDF
ncbi:SusC/RagA family TonB-linked outer membrane protein [Rudanella lutea]|uniref:SusC/RagA family TonB-linked outer membrane protein n=1 Tax=Rudanella lutea TaxID=451374 RepID=UPI0003679A49|nr:TonB-dependent receptor [Rudanella lutea]